MASAGYDLPMASATLRLIFIRIFLETRKLMMHPEKERWKKQYLDILKPRSRRKVCGLCFVMRLLLQTPLVLMPSVEPFHILDTCGEPLAHFLRATAKVPDAQIITKHHAARCT